jgi:1,4-alpha-glucan branching enzyme
VPNRFGGRENLEAIDFLRRVNETVYAHSPGTTTIAEESTAFGGVSHPTYSGGLGFGFKWNMGFMNDTLRYMSRESVHRKFHHNDMTFAALYAYSENFILPLSHDEVVHGKRSLINKMSGDDWQQFATLRAYYAFMWAWPGKKLLFMGQEFAQREEWPDAKGLDWFLLDAGMHEGMRRLVGDLNAAYRAQPAMHERDCEPEGFEWLIGNDHQNSVFAWVRKAPGAEPVVVVVNMTPVPRDGYRVPMPKSGTWSETINTDAGWYGGTNTGNQGKVVAHESEVAGFGPYADLYVPPLATLYLKYDPA